MWWDNIVVGSEVERDDHRYNGMGEVKQADCHLCAILIKGELGRD